MNRGAFTYNNSYKNNKMLNDTFQLLAIHLGYVQHIFVDFGCHSPVTYDSLQNGFHLKV